MKILYYLIISFFLLTNLRCTNEDIFGEELCEEDSLWIKSDFLIGVAVNPNLLKDNAIYENIVKTQFNSITAENIMKPVFLQPEQNRFFFDESDELIEFCLNNNKKIHGHTLVWDKQIPEWMESYDGDFTDLLKTHIQSVVYKYKGTIESWDVVNEAFVSNGDIKDNLWKRNLGNGYIAQSFLYAGEADPDALLFYNDTFKFKEDYTREKLDSVLRMVEFFQKHKVPIHGIGFQMHLILEGDPPLDEIRYAFWKVVSLGLKVRISEFDIQIVSELSNEKLLRQKKLFKEVVSIYNELPKESKHGITFWGVSDADTWKKNTNPLLYDNNYNIKPAYCGVIEGL